MKIAVNTRLLLSGKLEGIGWFSFEVLKWITQNHPEHEFIFIFDRPYSEEFIFSKNIKPIVIGPPSRHPLLWYWWFNYSVPKILKQEKADLFFSPDGFLSLNTSIPQIPIIHDLNFEHFPKDLPFSHRTYYRTYFKKYASIAKKIGTVSEYSKKDICDTYSINPNKISIVYNGVNEQFKPLSLEEINSTKQKYTEGSDYFLFIGALHPRKNISRLIKAFDLFKQKTQSNFKLVLAGNKKWWTPEMETALNEAKYKSDIIFTGRISQEDLLKLMGAAYTLTYIPYFEGFGIPIIEGMKAGTAVITSNITCMPEVAGDAALLINPENIESIAGAMIQISNNPDLRKQLIEKGKHQAKSFSWDKTAEKVWNLIMS
jgi:glycosyltransferase involved in cell wall biosynthesis